MILKLCLAVLAMFGLRHRLEPPLDLANAGCVDTFDDGAGHVTYTVNMRGRWTRVPSAPDPDSWPGSG